jgi:hypothetical protein
LKSPNLIVTWCHHLPTIWDPTFQTISYFEPKNKNYEKNPVKCRCLVLKSVNISSHSDD